MVINQILTICFIREESIWLIMRVCIGGTFNRFHKGHQTLIDTAIQYAGKNGFLFIGVSSGPLIKNKPLVEPYEKRKENLLFFLQEKKSSLPTIVIEPIETVEGPTLTLDFDLIVVSSETKRTAEQINQKRLEKGMKTMEIITIPLVLAEDEKKISSTRIMNNEIDSEGHVL